VLQTYEADGVREKGNKETEERGSLMEIKERGMAVGSEYRCPDGPDTTGGTTHDTKNTTQTLTRHDGRSVSVGMTR
jgi:hypothetical protein